MENLRDIHRSWGRTLSLAPPCQQPETPPTSGGVRNFTEPGQKNYRKTLLPSCE